MNAVIYYANLVFKYGFKNYKKHISGRALTITMLRGAVAGSIGIVRYWQKIGVFDKVGVLIMSFQLAPAAYFFSNLGGKYSRRGFIENQFLSLFSPNKSIIYGTIVKTLERSYSGR
ncbi:MULTISPECIES: hypothetical protein [Bacillaceae]|uniref:Uncharacterized protein n=1 Tax=Peribacillus huizhouensis TaxID=1501239 RepID=A0ABR6CRH6_9BACI|nr:MULTISPECIES: hypothetical protein [Bacillaceae]MBA9027631.1 hypothetical protein [Peribacillus huizhouensis]